MATKLFMHALPVRRKIALIYSISERSAGNYVWDWLPRWGKAGKQLSILNITEEYLNEGIRAYGCIAAARRLVCVAFLSNIIFSLQQLKIVSLPYLSHRAQY